MSSDAWAPVRHPTSEVACRARKDLVEGKPVPGREIRSATRRQDAPVSKPEPHSSFVLQADCGPNMPGSGAAPSIDDMMTRCRP